MKRKVISLMLVCSLMGSLMVGCNGGSGEKAKVSTGNSGNSASIVTSKGTLPIVQEPITLSAFVIQSPKVDNILTNEATKELEKRTNIKLDLKVVPKNAAKEKENLLIASGDYPEIFLSSYFSETDLMVYGANQKIFQPLNKLIDEYCVEIPKTEQELPGFLKAITAPDGNIYSVPTINDALHTKYSKKMWLNTDWLKNINMEMPKTTEEFYQVLKAFKEKDPNGNGKKDEIPLSGAFMTWNGEPEHFLMNAFIYDDKSTYLRNLDNEVDFVADSEEWREGIRYINKLYKEGLIDPAAFSQKLDQLRQLGNREEMILGAATTGHIKMFIDLDHKDERHKIYQPVAPLVGPKGVQIAPGGNIGIGNNNFIITDKCEAKEVAIRLADYLYSEEGTLLMEAGPENRGWKKADDGLIDLKQRQARWQTVKDYVSEGTVQNINWNQSTVTKRLSEDTGYRGYWAYSEDMYSVEGYERRLYDVTKNFYEPYKSNQGISSRIFFTKEQIDEVGALRTNIKTYVEQSLVRFITGDLDIEKDWDSYLKGLENLQVEEYVAYYAQALGLKH